MIPQPRAPRVRRLPGQMGAKPMQTPAPMAAPAQPVDAGYQAPTKEQQMGAMQQLASTMPYPGAQAPAAAQAAPAPMEQQPMAPVGAQTRQFAEMQNRIQGMDPSQMNPQQRQFAEMQNRVTAAQQQGQPLNARQQRFMQMQNRGMARGLLSKPPTM